jgi:hypothetical protein
VPITAGVGGVSAGQRDQTGRIQRTERDVRSHRLFFYLCCFSFGSLEVVVKGGRALVEWLDCEENGTLSTGATLSTALVLSLLGGQISTGHYCHTTTTTTTSLHLARCRRVQ